MSQPLSYLGLTLRYPDNSGAVTSLSTGAAKPSDIDLPLGLSSRFLNLSEGFMLHADGSRIIYTYFRIDNPEEPVVASISMDISLLMPGRPVVNLLAALRNTMASRTPVTPDELSELAIQAGFPATPPPSTPRVNPFGAQGPVAWRTYMSGSDLAAIFTFPCQRAYSNYAATLILQPTVIANPEKSLPRLPDTLDRQLWAVCPEGVGVSRNPVDASGKLTITYTRTGFAPAEQTIDVGSTSRFARISGPALIIQQPEKAGIVFSRKINYTVTDENGSPIPTHTVLVDGRTAVRDAGTFMISSHHFHNGKAEVSVSATNYHQANITVTPEMLADNETINVTLSPEKQGTLFRFDFGDGRIFENSVTFEKNDEEYRQLRAGRFHGFRAHRIVGSQPETYNVVLSAGLADDPAEPAVPRNVAPVFTDVTAGTGPEPTQRKAPVSPDIRPLEENGAETDDAVETESADGKRLAKVWMKRIAILVAALAVAGALAWFFTRPDALPSAQDAALTTATTDSVFPDAEPAPQAPEQTSQTAAPAAADTDMGDDLQYLNSHNVWRRSELTTEAGRKFFDTLVSGNIDAIAATDYFAVTGKATNTQAVKIMELLWGAKGTGTQNSNQRVLTARKKSGEINLHDTYESLARFRDSNPNKSPRPTRQK